MYKRRAHRSTVFYRRAWDRIRDKARTCAKIRESETFAPLTQYEHDFPGFCLDVLGVELWDGQKEIGLSVQKHERTSVSACYASGKTFTAACLAIWWVYSRRPAMVITTAPTGRQVKTLLWREIRKLKRKALIRLPGRILQTQLWIAEDQWGMGFASNAPNSVAGLHEAKNVLFIEDEAAGMDAETVEGFEGITASEGSRHLKIGNPIAESGPFFDSHMDPEEAERWNRIQIDAEQTPNVLAGPGKVVVPGLVTWEWVEDKRKRWLARGLMALWQTKVKGRFVVTAGEKLIPTHWIENSKALWATIEDDPHDEVVLAVDVAGGGQDETCLYMRKGRRIHFVDSWQEEDLMLQGRRIAEIAKNLGASRIVIDRTGLGQGVWCKVVEIQENGALEGVEIIGLALQKGAEDPETFNRRQDEVLWGLRMAMDPTAPPRPGLAGPIAIDPADTVLHKELNLRGWTKDENEKIRAESKRELRKRKVGSPDRADAVSMLFVEEKQVFCGFL